MTDIQEQVPSMIPSLYPLTESSELLHVSADFNRARLRDRTWPGVKIAGRWYMTEADILEAIRLMSHTARELAEQSPAGLVPGSRFRRRVREAS